MSRRKPRDVTLVTSGNAAEAKFGFGNLRPALVSNSEEAELFQTIIHTRGAPNYHAHTKKALKTTNSVVYIISEGINEKTSKIAMVENKAKYIKRQMGRGRGCTKMLAASPSLLCNFFNCLSLFQRTLFSQYFNILHIIYGIRSQIYGQGSTR
ncbi:hypothetical protein B0H14DRAFT_2590822 [Mycena olivaceomarginata]|nr:hypothetical protein B0H14DRAFT_2590822 [Mycena olivaceomarginata]